VRTHSGTPPYQAPDAGLDRWNAMPMVDVPVIDPRTIRPDLQRDLAAFLLKACAPVSAERFATAAEMRLALSDIRAHL
jgi:hypothetical protein